MMPNPPFDMPLATKVAYLVDVVAWFVRERQSLRTGVVRLVNDNNVLVVNRTGRHTIHATPLRVIMDFGAQLVMIGKRLAQELSRSATNVEPCPFTIVTSVGP